MFSLIIVRQIIVALFLLASLTTVLFLPFVHALPVSKQLLEQIEEESKQEVGTKEREESDGILFQRERPVISSTSASVHRFRHQQHQVNRLKEAFVYLRRYGYMKEKQSLNQENVEQALKAFQQMAGIKDSGRLTKKTMEKMHSPRCGNIDVENPAKLSKMKKRFAQVSKWTDKKDENDILHLKWFIEKSTKDISLTDIRDVVQRAFKLWSTQSTIPGTRIVKLDFVEAANDADSDISIMWAEGEHGDAYPFDGPGNATNILAHTFYPNYQETGSLNGNIHFDDYEKWVLDDAPTDTGVHFPYVLVHEIGHALGLGHSKRQEAIMNPIYKQTPLDLINLDIDDKCAINWNYIGPSNTCLFVWLMVELLPRAKDTNSSHGIISPQSSNTGSDLDQYTRAVGEQMIDFRINQTLDSLQISQIPLCSDSNDIQSQYEELLVRKLDFPKDSAQRYGPIVCNYLSGLTNVVQKRKRSLKSDSSSANDSQGPLKISVHSYPTSPYGALQYSDFHEPPPPDVPANELTDEDLKNTYSLLQRQNNENTIFNKNYFDETFFKNILRLFLTRLT